MIICLNFFCLDEGGERRTGPSEWEGGVTPGPVVASSGGATEDMRISVGGLDVRDEEERNHPPMLILEQIGDAVDVGVR